MFASGDDGRGARWASRLSIQPSSLRSPWRLHAASAQGATVRVLAFRPISYARPGPIARASMWRSGN